MVTRTLNIESLNPENAATNTYSTAKGSHNYLQETVDISSTGDKLTIENIGSSTVSLNIEANSEATYSLEVGPEENILFEEETYTGTSIRDAFILPDKYCKILVTSPVGTNEEATITFQVAR